MGHVIIPNNFLKWEWFDEPLTVSLFVHFLLRANHDPYKWHDIPINRGQFITRREELSQQTGLTISQIRTRMKNLESTGHVIIKPTTKFTIVTVCNYEKYYGKEEQKR